VLVINGQKKEVYVFEDASLKELRAIAGLDVNFRFFYEGLVVTSIEEEFIFVKEVISGGTIVVSSSSSSSESVTVSKNTSMG
jgi:hypothetical protein